MLGVFARMSLVVAGVSGVAVSSSALQDQLGLVRQQLQQMPASPAASSQIAAAIAQWKQAQQPGAATFDSYASFLLAHPGWPGEAAIRRSAERALDTGSWSAGVATSYFRRFPPLTSAGMVRFAQALASTGRQEEAAAAARAAWARATLAPGDETALLIQFSSALTPADYDARMDALLWAGATTAAQRVLGRVSTDKRALFEARLALRTNAAGAAAVATTDDPRFASNAGYIADRATWLNNAGQAVQAQAWLARPHNISAKPADAERWYKLLLGSARAAASAGQYETAYNIARQVDDAYPSGTNIATKSYGERDAYTDLTWLAGQIALKQLGRPVDAIGMFSRYAGGSSGPAVQARGFYWAGRAASAAGRRAEANGWLDKASLFPDQFYGQLATELLGRALLPPPDVMARPVGPAAREAFYNSDIVRAARYLGTIGAHEDQTAFVRQIALDATSDADHVLAAELSRSLGRPDLSVMVGRSALRNGLTDYAAAGYPSVAVPDEQVDAWTIIHAIARQESQFDRAAISRAGARGLMQLLPATAREQAGKLGVAFDSGALIANPQYNIQLGSSYFQRLYKVYGSYPLAIAAYNAGGGNVNKWLRANGDPRTAAVDMIDWIEAIPFTETRGYVQHVLENAVIYDLLNPTKSRSNGQQRISWYLSRTPAAG